MAHLVVSDDDELSGSPLFQYMLWMKLKFHH